MLLGILLTVQIIISLIIIVLVLIQRSEGGALGMGGGPSGFMSARGAGNLLTKATSVMGLLFFVNCIGMTVVGNYASRPSSAVDSVDTSSLILPGAPQTANSAQAPAAATSSSTAPSLNDLPLSGPAAAPVAAPSAPASSAAPRAASQRPSALPAPLSSSASSQAPRVGNIFANASSSSAAPASTAPSQP